MLCGALLALLATAWVVQAMPPPTEMATAVPRHAHAGTVATNPLTTAPHGSGPLGSAPQGTGAPGAASAVTAVPGAVTGSVTLAHARGDCGLSLGATDAPSAVGHCTVLEVGDSLGNDLGWGLARHVGAGSGLHLVQRDRSETGLAKPSFYDWPTHLASDLHRYHPQLVLICLGGNDEQGIVVGGRAVQFPTGAWKSAYLARVRGLVSQATASGAYVLWVGLPIMRQPSYQSGMRILDGLYRDGVTSEPNATYVSTWSLLSNPHGAFQQDAVVAGRRTVLREPDGVHLSFAGEDVLATYVIHEMALIYHVRLAPAHPVRITNWG